MIEVYGDSHFTDAGQEYDRQRDAHLKALGLTVLRFINREVDDGIDGCLQAIVRALEQTEASGNHYRQWCRADTIRVSDVVFFGPKRLPIEISDLACEDADEDVYSIEVDGAHSFLTEVCVMHDRTSPLLSFSQAKSGPGGKCRPMTS